MPVSLHHVVVDAHDLPGLARFWSQVLDWPILSAREREVVIGPADDARIGMCFMPSPDDKVVKNRVHLDLNPGADASDSEREAEIERIIGLGARRVDVGQRGDETWTVLTDPEGNEFCVIRPKRTLTT
jgi:predicted enzyme related to lactoylglutathione lyase